MLMEERRMRVMEEPNLADSHVTITVRHPNLDTKLDYFTLIAISHRFMIVLGVYPLSQSTLS